MIAGPIRAQCVFAYFCNVSPGFSKNVVRSMKTVADQFSEILAAAGVKRIYGIVGDSLNGLTDAIRRQAKIEWVHVRHEEVAAFAAGAEAHLTGELAVCAGSCGPGNLHLINGLFDCHRSRVPVLAIAAQIPSAEIGSGYFQETHPQTLFKECSHYCELVSGANQMPRTLEIAIREAVGRGGVSVIVIPGDVALQPAGDALAPKRSGLLPLQAVTVPAAADLDQLAEMLNGSSRVTVLCGSGCAGAHEELLALGECIKAPMVHALRGKEHVEWENPYDVGMTGLIGFSSGYYAMLRLRRLADARVPTSPIANSIRRETALRIAQVDIRAENIGRRAAVDLGIGRRCAGNAAALLPLLEQEARRHASVQAQQHYAKSRKALDDLAERHTWQAADPSAADRQGDQRPRGSGRHLHLRCRSADGVGRALSDDERQAAACLGRSGTARWPTRWRRRSARRRPSRVGRWFRYRAMAASPC